MHVLVTGATGFIGGYVLRALSAHGHTARALARHHDAPLPVPNEVVERVQGDVTDPASLHDAMDGCDAVIHLVGIIDEKPSRGITFGAINEHGTRNVVEGARAAGIERFIHMSANDAAPDAHSTYHVTKWQAEQHVQQAGFAYWTIFRPSIIFGDPGEHDVSFEVRLSRDLVKPFPILPIFGDGTYRLQPVHVEVVAEGFVQALTSEAARGQVYPVGGPAAPTYVEALDLIARALGTSPKPKLHLPLWLARLAVHTLGRLGLLPISPAQFEMLVQGNTCDPTAFYRDFDVPTVAFTPENMPYLPARV